MVVHSEKEAHVVRLTQQLELLVAHPERVGQIVRTPALHTRCAHTAPQHSAESRRKTSSSDSAPAKTPPGPGPSARERETADPEHCSNIH